MAVTAAQFRQNFSEFGNQSRFPTGFIQFWLNWSYQQLNACRFGSALDMAAQLWAAHNLAIERTAMDQGVIAANNNQGSVGGQVGVVNNKSVDKVSVGFDVSSFVDPDSGYWGSTIYGARFWQLMMMAGAGPVQIGACGPIFTYNQLQGWPGWWNGWNQVYG